MEYKARPHLGPATKLDFSKFHPLDHSLLRCGDYPGGLPVHLKYGWEFRWGPKLRSLTKCKVGHHSRGQLWRRDNVDTPWFTGIACVDCGKQLSALQPE